MNAPARHSSVYADPPWVGDYIGVPFAKRGYDFSGWHCYGLIRCAYQRQCSIALPHYGPVSAADVVKAARTIRAAQALPPWQHVASLAPGEASQDLVRRVRRSGLLRAFDVAVMLNGEAVPDAHVGLMIGSRRLIHAEEGCNTVKVDLLDPTIEWRVTGFYRHEALA